MSTLAQTYKRVSNEISPRHLTYIEGDGNYSRIHLADGSSVLFSRTLKRFVDLYPFLIRISKEALVNPDSITGWDRVDQRTMWVAIAGRIYWIPRRRIDRVLQRIAETRPPGL